MASTLKTEVVQNPSSATVNLTLDASGGVAAGQNLSVTGTTTLTGAVTMSTNATSSGTVVMSSPYTMRNKIINGAMVIDQRNAGASVTPTNAAYTIDRWKFYVAQASKFTSQQNAGSVTPPSGFTNYLGVTSSSAYTVLTGDYFTLDQLIEGLNTADLNWGSASAQTVTVSFWVRSSLTGVFSGGLYNSANNRSYVFTYNINSANTWEQKTITISGDTTGTWLTTNGSGIGLRFNLGGGSTYQTTANTWAAGNFFATSSSVNVVGTNGATFYITGVQLEAGSAASPFENRSYGTELALCQRYYEIQYAGSAGSEVVGTQRSASNFWSQWSFAVTKRASPTVSLTSSGSWVEGTPTIYPTISYVQFNRAGSYYGAGTNNVGWIQAASEL